MRICTDCKQEKPLDEYASHPKTGKQHRCKICQRIVSKQWYQNNKQQHKQNVYTNKREQKDTYYNWKADQQCCVCDEHYSACLDLHHVDGTKEKIVSELVGEGWGYSAIVGELNKCVVICSNCHRKIHNGFISLNNNIVKPLSLTVYEFKEYVSVAQQDRAPDF